MAVQFTLQYDNPDVRIDLPLLQQRADWLLERLNVKNHNVSIVLMDDAAITHYNLKYRRRQGPTNVLSFPVQEEPPLLKYA